MEIVLASKSPRRKELLSFILQDFIIDVSEEEEKADFSKLPGDIAAGIAAEKAKNVSKKYPSAVTIGADTIVVIDGEILGKPKNREDAFRMLRKLSGREHSVFTGVCIVSPEKTVSFYEETKVEFFPLSDEEINAYINTGDPFDKAGSYGIQQKGAVLVKGITGDFYNVMGLPVAKLSRELKSFGAF